MKKIILCTVVFLCIAASVTVVIAASNNTTDNGGTQSAYTKTRLDELEKKQQILERLQNSKNVSANNEEDTFSGEDSEIGGALAEAQRRAVIRKDYCERTVALINRTLGTQYDVDVEFNYELMRAAIDAYRSEKTNEKEKELLKSYMGEYCCGVDGKDPMYEEIMQIFDYPFGGGLS